VHISDGILPVSACIAAEAVALGAASWLGRKIEAEEVVRMGLLASAIFVVSMVHFPVGGTSIHLGLFGLGGVILGRRAIPVAFATLLFQALLFQHGGLLAHGVNTINMGTGMLVGALLWRWTVIPEGARAVLAGFLGAFVPACLVGLEFFLAGYGKGFGVIAAAYSVVALIEGAVTGFIVSFLRRVKPAVLARAAA
jgi:cobalt/nickel transport system permease protein